MQRDAIAAIIAGRLNRSDMTTNILGEMSLVQSTQLEGAPFLPWFTEVTDSTLSITANLETVSVPASFIREVDGEGLFYLDPTTSLYKAIVKDDYDNMVKQLDATSTVPQAYAIIGSKYYFRPVPTQNLSLLLIYNQKLADPSTGNIENGWMLWAPDLVIGAVGFIIASQYLQNPEQAQVFDLQRKEGIQRLNIMHEARAHANRDYRMGGVED